MENIGRSLAPWDGAVPYRRTEPRPPKEGSKPEILSCVLTKMRETDRVRLFLFIARKIVG